MSLTRQYLRLIGRAEVNAQAKKRFPGMSRSKRRSIAASTHRNSWKARDRRAIAKAKLVHEIAEEAAIAS